MTQDCRKHRTFTRLSLLLGLLLTNIVLAGPDYIAIPVPNESEINVEVYAAKSDILFIWQPHEKGIQDIDRQLAQQIASQGIEVWLVDVLESYFLPNTASNMERVPVEGVTALLSAASKSNKRIVVGASGRGAVPILRGIHHWQGQQKDPSHYPSLLLLSPKLFIETPDPGKRGALLPVRRRAPQSEPARSVLA